MRLDSFCGKQFIDCLQNGWVSLCTYPHKSLWNMMLMRFRTCSKVLPMLSDEQWTQRGSSLKLLDMLGSIPTVSIYMVKIFLLHFWYIKFMIGLLLPNWPLSYVNTHYFPLLFCCSSKYTAKSIDNFVYIRHWNLKFLHHDVLCNLCYDKQRS